MLLSNLLKSVGTKYRNINIKGISFDSRKVKKKDIFFAIKGTKVSGDIFIKEALLKGASIVVIDKKTKPKNNKKSYLLVPDVRKSLTEVCSNFYKKKPSNIIAVTGTNGKSSVVDFFYQILTLNKMPVASIGTLGIFSKNFKKKTNLTSIDPISLHKNIQTLKKNGIENLILEASSHGLDQKRLDNLNFRIGIFTNLSHDHLDYHKNMKTYLNTKMYLFKSLLKKNSKIITDEDNKEFNVIKNIANKKKIKKITIGTNSGYIRILDNRYDKTKQIVKISIRSKIFIFKTSLIGFFQIKNLLMAILAAMNSGLNQNKILSQIHKIKPVRGRLEHVAKLKNNSNIIIDFAHTPDALEQSLIALKKQFKKKITIVFGCGGDRDKKKRLTMGKIAKKYCQKIFVTDDNPRNENPQKIRNSIIRGCKNLAFDIGDRKEAIKTAMQQLGPNEILLITGKGHEKTQDYGKNILSFSDHKIVKEIIKKKLSFKNTSWANFIVQRAFKNKNIKNIDYNGVSINTKTIKKNNLFFAIKGKNNDGHKFINEALKKGAIKSVVSKRLTNLSKNKQIKVKNTLLALNNLARITRDTTNAKIIGITGSAGKTTLKNLVGFALKKYGKVYHSPHSYNNKFGVPLSLSNLRSDSEYGVFEIGMDKKGEINNLSKIINPEIGVITNISEAHLKNFSSIKEIAKTKAELIDNILKDGKIILNKDDKFFNFLSKKAKRKKVKVISFSLKKNANISFLNIKRINNYYKLKIMVKGETFDFDVSYSTDSFLSNILACISVLSALNLDLNEIKNLTNFNIPSGRGDIKIIKKFNKKFKFIDESYNANPLSMTSAIKNVNSQKRKNNEKKLVFLGDMLELGIKSKKLHKSLSSTINKSDIDKVFVYGKHIRETFNCLAAKKRGKIFNNLVDAYDHFSKILHNHDLLMVKGSNATGLNKFSQNIKKVKHNAL